MSQLIPLTQGQFAIVDDDMFDYLSQFKWSIDGSGYPQRATKTEKGWRPRRMHRDILGLEGDQGADHINLNKLDNRIANLRRCTARENVLNRSAHRNNSTGYKGVYFNEPRGVFQAYITVEYKHKFIGAFRTALDAAKAYDAAARHHFGQFARLNFPESE